MKYKALMLDVDGTIIPYNFDAMPSDRVSEAIKKAQKKVTVCLVTGRSIGSLLPIIKKIELSFGYLVTDTGAHVIKLPDKEVLYEQPIESEDVKKICDILFAHKLQFYAKTEIVDEHYAQKAIQKDQKLPPTFMIYVTETVPSAIIDKVVERLSRISSITTHKSRHKLPGMLGLNISHVKATKLHGVEVVMKAMNIKREEIIAVGDSYNDFPLLMAAGFKVAMGNAIPDLKDIADFVAPTVTDDGVATVIEKFL